MKQTTPSTHEDIINKFLPTHLCNFFEHYDNDSIILEGNTPLHYISGHGHTKIVKIMSMNSVVNVNTQDIEGKAPLHYAVEGVGKNTVKILLTQTTVDVDIQDLKSRTPLNDVTRGYYEERAKTLPADGSDAVNNISLTSK